MNAMELLSPAGSFEGVRAAVQSGANAVYMGFGTFNARRGAKNFSKEEMEQAIAYCRVRGVKTNITFNIVTLDREREQALADARFLYEAGADALIVQDLGLARRIRKCAPNMALHASTQMTVNTVDGAKAAKALGFSRVVLARECSLEQIRRITAEAGIETEVFVHGALCMCYSGQCYFSSVIGQRSGNRGLCAQPCRLAYRYDKTDAPQYPLSLKDLSLADWLSELRQAGVASLKIEGRMKRPEYAAVVTGIYADLLRENRKPNAAEQKALQKVFSRDGFTDGYLTTHQGDAMFGTKTEVPLREVQPLYDEAAHRFAQGKEAPLVPISMELFAHANEPIRLLVSDGSAAVTEEGAPPEAARQRATTQEDAMRSLGKTGGTPFSPQDVVVHLDEGLSLPNSLLNHLRRGALQTLQDRRAALPIRPDWNAMGDADGAEKKTSFRGHIVEVRALEQITEGLLRTAPQAIYAPLETLEQDLCRTQALCARLPVAAVLPRIYTDEEWPALRTALQQVQSKGVAAVLVGNIGQILPVREMGFAVYGDFGLNITNSDALQVLADSGVQRQTLSFELRLPQLRDLQKPIETEMLVYGYLPLMIFENCAIRRRTGKCTCEQSPCSLTDRTGKRFRLLPEHGCRNTLLNSQPLYLPQRAAYQDVGTAYARLRFTVESPAQCEKIAQAFASGTVLEFPEGVTRGLYFRGVT